MDLLTCAVCSWTTFFTQRSEIAGLYKLLKEQPFDQELFEVMLVSESSLVHRLTEVSALHMKMNYASSAVYYKFNPISNIKHCIFIKC